MRTTTRACGLPSLSGVVWLGWNKALDIVEHDDPAVRARETSGLQWWLARAEEALEGICESDGRSTMDIVEVIAGGRSRSGRRRPTASESSVGGADSVHRVVGARAGQPRPSASRCGWCRCSRARPSRRSVPLRWRRPRRHPDGRRASGDDRCAHRRPGTAAGRWQGPSTHTATRTPRSTRGSSAADHLIHGWDLARGTGQDTTMDPELVTAVAAGSPTGSRCTATAGRSGHGSRRPRRTPRRRSSGRSDARSTTRPSTDARQPDLELRGPSPRGGWYSTSPPCAMLIWRTR